MIEIVYQYWQNPGPVILKPLKSFIPQIKARPQENFHVGSFFICIFTICENFKIKLF